MQTQYPYCIGS